MIRLGCEIDKDSFNKFNATLKDSAKIFGDFSLNTIANFGKLEVAIVDLWHNDGASNNYFTQAFQEAKQDAHSGGLDYNRKNEPAGSSPNVPNDTAATAARLEQRVSKDAGLPADLIFAQWEFETGKFTNPGTKNLNNLGSIKISGTDVFKKFESLDQYADAYEKSSQGPVT